MAPTRAGQPGVKLGKPLPFKLMLIVTGFAQRHHPLLHDTMRVVIESLTSAKFKPLNGQAD